MGETSKRTGSRSGLIALVIFAVLGIVVLASIRHPDQLVSRLASDRAAVHSFIAHAGLWAPLGYVLGYAALMLLIWVPAWPCTVIGGILFGPWFGIAYALTGSTLGGTAVFLTARSGLAGRLPRDNPFVQRLEAGFQRDALLYVFALRAIPVMPFGIVHVAAAAFDVPLGKFVIGTVLGMIPNIAIFAFLGGDLDTVAARGAALDAGILLRPNVFIPLSALALLALLPIVVKRFRP